MKAIAVIPARLGSTRLPRKVLADMHGHPMVWHVWNRASQARLIETVYVATDSEEVSAAVEAWGGHAIMTSPECRSGTERIASALERFDADLVINVQGDEPLLDPKLLDGMVEAWQADPCDLITPVYRIGTVEEIQASAIVKVARTLDGHALYFSRSPIPFVRDLPPEEWLAQHTFWGHVGVYGYRRNVLETYHELPASPLETAESLEQLRFLDAGYRFRTVETTYRPVAVDTPADLERVRLMLGGGA
jgi:3-deoxy-manno-octulosonate cytidylyltransferase (CMP-KDO synthetase)